MADKSPIEWTDATWNPVRGCTRLSDGCGGPQHQGGCYAEKIAARFSGPGQPFHGFAERTVHGGRWTGRLALVEDKLLEPLSWKKPRRIFVNSMSDLFHENLPDEAIDRVFAVMALCPQHTFQVLTKRAKRMREYLSGFGCDGARRFNIAAAAGRMMEDGDNACDEVANAPWPLPNVWLGVSAENQKTADERIPKLLATPAAIRFVSAEPLLGPIDWTSLCTGQYFVDALKGLKYHDAPEGVHGATEQCPALDWVIVGGESGPRSRPMHPDWPRQIRDQCRNAGVAFFFKQWGEHLGGQGHDHGDGVWFEAASGEAQSRWVRTDDSFDWFDSEQEGPEGPMHLRIGRQAVGRLLDGHEHNEFPIVD